MKNLFKNIFRGKTVIVGIGNILKGDDGAGPLLVESIRKKINALCIDAGTAPENYLGKITKEKPDTVLFVDAADIGGEPGEYCILKKEEILKTGFTTHDLSPRMLIEYLGAETSAEVYLLGIQPSRIGLGDEVSDEVKNTILELTELIKENPDA